MFIFELLNCWIVTTDCVIFIYTFKRCLNKGTSVVDVLISTFKIMSLNPAE